VFGDEVSRWGGPGEALNGGAVEAEKATLTASSNASTVQRRERAVPRRGPHLPPCGPGLSSACDQDDSGGHGGFSSPRWGDDAGDVLRGRAVQVQV
jgi:hypothetical protein